jgi:hypothetical protein
MSQIFLPLRSNAAWFSGPEMRRELERRIKNCMLFYDKILIQDGRYICTVGEGGVLDWLYPPDAMNFDRTEVKYFDPVKSFSFRIFPKDRQESYEIMGGKAIAHFTADFFPILHKAGLLDVNYIDFFKADLSDDWKSKAKTEAESDKNDSNISKILPNNYFQRSKILESLYIDSFLSYFLSSPFLVDYNVAPAIQWKNEQRQVSWKSTIQGFFLKIWISLRLPDYGNLPWEKVHEVRESSAGVDFRNMLNHITREISTSMQNFQNESEVSELVTGLFVQELVDKLYEHLPTTGDAIVNLAVNLIPFGGGAVIGGAKDLQELISTRNSWVSLLKFPT